MIIKKVRKSLRRQRGGNGAGGGAAAAADVSGNAAAPAPPAAQPRGVTGIYIINANRELLIHRRALTLDQGGTLSTPGGELEDSEEHKAAAIRELAEEAQVVPPPSPDDLKVFKVDGANKFYYWDVSGPITVNGPTPESVNEIDDYDFADISGSPTEPLGSRHFWASLDALGPWLSTHPDFKNELFATNLASLLATLGPPPQDASGDQQGVSGAVGASDVVAGPTQIPTWVPSTYFDDEDLELIRTKCGATQFITADCIAKAVLKDIQIADEFAAKSRLSMSPNTALKKYQKLAEEVATLRGKGSARTQEESNRMAVVEKQLSEGYPDHEILVYRPEENRVNTLPVPNPYRALAYREEPTTSFANPTGESQYNVGGVMRAQNVEVLKALVPSEMIADNRMAIALLESLWFCGSNPSVSNDPRCFPAKILGELREFQQSKRVVQRAATAADVKGSAWADVRQWVAALKQAAAGAEIFPYVKERSPVLPQNEEEGKEEEEDEAPPLQMDVSGAPAPAPASPAPPPEGPTEGEGHIAPVRGPISGLLPIPGNP